MDGRYVRCAKEDLQYNSLSVLASEKLLPGDIREPTHGKNRSMSGVVGRESPV